MKPISFHIKLYIHQSQNSMNLVTNSSQANSIYHVGLVKVLDA